MSRLGLECSIFTSIEVYIGLGLGFSLGKTLRLSNTFERS